MPVAHAANLMAGVKVPWWFAGGWAIDLFLGKHTWPHGDTDILIRRDDQLAVQAYLASKELLLYKAKQGTLPKDQSDFDLVVPRLQPEARVWLLRCLEQRFPQSHPWITRMRRTN
jgi:hypothetical protein